MIPLHEQIASDHYWDGPAMPAPEHVSFISMALDAYQSSKTCNEIDRTFQAIVAQGAVVRTIQPGEELAVEVPGGLLKVVEDWRIQPKKGTWENGFVSPDLFDAEAQEMVDQLLYSGNNTAAKVETQVGTVGVARRTIYLQNTASDARLIGKPSGLLGISGAEFGAVYMGHEPVGHVAVRETRKNREQRRIISAEVISTGGLKRAKKVIDLGAFGARLSSPSGA